LQVGDFIVFPFRSLWKDVLTFRDLLGDSNPIHWDIQYASRLPIGKPIQHGAALVSAVCGQIGSTLPGEGALIVSISVEFPNPLYVGDEAEITLKVANKSEATRMLVLSVAGESGNGQVIRGNIVVKLLV
jgi:3-hydroxybutyryl-CoA dehydratase